LTIPTNSRACGSGRKDIRPRFASGVEHPSFHRIDGALDDRSDFFARKLHTKGEDEHKALFRGQARELEIQ
jgi:hypothetical protein